MVMACPCGGFELMVVMLTRACSLRCVYCRVKLGPQSISWSNLRTSIDLLLRSEQAGLEIAYVGGEPLQRYDLIQRAVLYAESRREQGAREIRHIIMTNGVLLDERKISWLAGHKVEVWLSLDGSAATQRRHRPGGGRADQHGRILANLRFLQASGLPYGISTVVTPDNVAHARDEIALIASLGCRQVELYYQYGVEWSEEQSQRLLELEAEGLRGALGIELRNFRGDFYCLSMYNNNLIIDTDGGVYLALALFSERNLPKVRARLGHVSQGRILSALRPTRAEVVKRVLSCYPKQTLEWKIFSNNLRLERRMIGVAKEVIDKEPSLAS